MSGPEEETLHLQVGGPLVCRTADGQEFVCQLLDARPLMLILGAPQIVQGGGGIVLPRPKVPPGLGGMGPIPVIR
jgi:hypothetical protein